MDSVTLSVTAPGGAPFGRYDDVPVSGSFGEVLWATPAAVVHQLPSLRLELTLTPTDNIHTELGRYVLDHSATAPPAASLG